MEKINFINQSTPALNATNLNKLQDNVEDSIDEAKNDMQDIINETKEDIEQAISSIIESGSNSNGNYVKYSDGTMVCTGKYEGNVSINNVLGSIYRSATITFNNFAAPFTRLDSIDFNLIDGQSGNFVWLGTYGDYSPSLTNPGRCVLFSGVSTSSTSTKVSYFAIGRWK